MLAAVHLLKGAFLFGHCCKKLPTYVSDDSKLNRGAGSGLDMVELEDEKVVQNVQKGIRSQFTNMEDIL